MAETYIGSYIVSDCASQSGYGTDRHKYVTGMSPYEREYVRNGGTLYFRAARLSGGNHGTLWRYVRAYRDGCGRWRYVPMTVWDETVQRRLDASTDAATSP